MKWIIALICLDIATFASSQSPCSKVSLFCFEYRQSFDVFFSSFFFIDSPSMPCFFFFSTCSQRAGSVVIWAVPTATMHLQHHKERWLFINAVGRIRRVLITVAHPRCYLFEAHCGCFVTNIYYAGGHDSVPVLHQRTAQSGRHIA